MARIDLRTAPTLRGLSPELRAKARRLASVFEGRGIPAERALEMGVARAGMWARHRGRAPQPAHHRPREGALPVEPVNPARPGRSRPRREAEAPELRLPSNPPPRLG